MGHSIYGSIIKCVCTFESTAPVWYPSKAARQVYELYCTIQAGDGNPCLWYTMLLCVYGGRQPNFSHLNSKASGDCSPNQASSPTTHDTENGAGDREIIYHI